MRIPLAQPDLTGREAEYVARAVESTWISSSGEFLRRFETEWAAQCDVPHALAVSNGTVALHVILEALGCGPGDEVIVPSLTYIASVNAIRYTGATPVFAEVREDTWCMDPEHVASLIGPRTVGLLPVHLYGQPADMLSLNALAARHGLWVVEDAAEAPLATVDGRPTGGLATAGTFSFYGNKVFTSGEGGAVTIRDHDLADRVRLLRGQGMDPQQRYYFPVVGYNYRLTNVAAAFLCAQVERAGEILARRWSVYRTYDEVLGGVPGVTLQQEVAGTTRTPWLYSILVDDTALRTSRDEVADSLAASGIETRPFFIPVHTLPPYSGLAPAGSLPVTERLARQGVNLPTSSVMTPDVAAEVAQVVKTAVAE